MNYAEYKQEYKSNANVVSSGTSDINNTMSYAEYQRTYKADTASAAISKFNSDYESYVNNAKSIGTTWRSDDDMKQFVADMSAKNTDLYSQLHRIRNFIDDDTYNALSEALNIDFTDDYLSAKDYNRQFVNEAAYKAEKDYQNKYKGYDYSALKKALASNPNDAEWIKSRMKAVGTSEQLTADKDLFVSKYVPLSDKEKAAYQKDTTLLANGRYNTKGYADMAQKAKVSQAAQTALKQDEEKAAKYEKENAAFETLLKQKKAASSAKVSDEDLKKALDDAKSKINNAKSEEERRTALAEKEEAEQAYNQRVNENAYQSEYAHLSLEEIAKKVDELNQKIAYAYENSTSATRDGYLGFLKQKENGVYSEEKLNKILNNGGLSALYVEAARAGYDDFYSYVEQQLDSEFNNAKYAYNRKLTEEYAFDHLDQLKAQIEVAEGDTKKELQQQYDELYHTVYGEKDWANYIVSNVGSGLSQWGSDMASGLDFILSLPNKVSGGNLYINNSPTQLLKEGSAKSYEQAQAAAEAATKAMGESDGWKTGAQVISGVSAAIPDLVIAYLTAGSGTAASAAGKVASAGSKASKIFTTVKTAVKTTAKNPQFWTSFVREVGTTYDTALSSGATSNQATTAALISSLINAYIEVGGGIETLPDALKNADKSAVRVWVEQALDEGKEGVLQGIVSNLTQKVVYDHDKQLVSSTDDDAVISLTRAANEFMMGVAVGGILSAGPTAARGIASSYDQRVLDREGRKIIKNIQSDELYSIALQMPEGAVSRVYAEQNSEVLQSNTNKKTAAKTAQLRKYVVNDFLEQINVIKNETIDAIEKRYMLLAGKTKATAETRKDAEVIYKAYENIEMTSEENSRLLTAKNYGQILKELYLAAENDISPENEWASNIAITDVDEKYAQLEKVIDMVRVAKGEEVSQTESSAENTTQKTQPIEPVDMTPNVVPSADTVDVSPFTEPDLNEGDFHQQMLAEADGKPVSIQARNEVTSIAKKLGFKVIWKADINSNGYIKGNTIVLNSRQNKPILVTFVHEFVHSLEKSGKYREFLKFVWDSELFDKWVQKKSNKNLTKDELWERYQEAFRTVYGDEDIAIKSQREMICDFVADMLFRKDIDKGEIDPALLEAVKNHTFVDTILSWLKRMIEVFKKHPVQAELIKMQNDIQKLYKQAQKQGFENGEVRYSKNVDLYTEAGLDNDEEYQNMLVESSKSKDTDYLKAVEDGDMETAQKMVDEAAKKAGYSVKAYHGTPIKNITSFDSEKIGSNTDSGIFGRGFYFSTDEKTANVYATQDGQTMPVYLRYNNPWWAVAHRDVSKVAEELNMDARALTMRGYGGKGKIVAPSNLQEAQFSSHLQEKGYDSVVVQHGKNNYEIVVFNPTNIKSADPVTYDDDGNVIPLSKRFKENQDDIRFSLDIELDGETLNGEVYDTIPPGEKPARVVRVPKKVDGTYTNRFVRTIMEHGDISEYQAELLNDGVWHEAEKFRHEVSTNKSAIEYAEKCIKDGSAEEKFRKFADSMLKKPGEMKKGMAVGCELLLSYAKNGDIKKFLDCAADMSQLATEAGRMAQASQLLKLMTGAGRLYIIQQQVDKINLNLEKNFKKNAPVVKIDEQLAKMLCDTTSQNDANLLDKMIMQKVMEQVPATFMQKWNAWRYLSMLGNPRTHIRNIVGNLVFVPAVRIKDTLGAVIEKAIPEDERTKVIMVDKVYRKFAKEDFNSSEVTSILEGDDRKYDDGINLPQFQRIFKSKFLEKVRNFNFDMLEKEDMFFLKLHYIHALGSVLQARGIDLDTISKEQLDSAREYALKEAMKATYRDASNFATALKKLGASNKTLGFVIEAVFPFKKTPINIAKRAVEYSPIGLLRSIVKYGIEYGKYKSDADYNEKPSASEFIDNLCAGLTGTGIVLLGMLLGSLGLVKSLPDEDDEEFEKLIGSQNYSIELFGYSYTLDWAAPACIPFFMGVSLANMSEGETSNWFDVFASSSMDALSPMLEMSFVDGLNKVLSSVKYTQNSQKSNPVGDVANIAWSAMQSYLMQAVPTAFGQAARIIDPKSRNAYYTDKNSAIPEFAQQLINQVMAKTPGLSMLLPAQVDKWGNEIQTPLIEDVLENTISPGYLSKIEADKVDKELQRVYKSVGGTNIDGTIFPKTASKYYEAEGEKYYLTDDEYHDYQQLLGQSSKKYLAELIDQSYYNSLSDELKVEMIKNMYSYANAKAKHDLFGVSSKTYEKALAFEDAGFSVPEYYAAMSILSEGDESTDTNGDGTYSKDEKMQAILNSNLKNKDFYYAWEFWQGKKQFTQLETIEEKIKFVKSTIKKG